MVTKKGASGAPPPPTTYTASDGTTFTDRAAYRKYEFELSYCVRNRVEQTFIKRPGTIQGQPFDISDLENCEVQLLCWSDMVQIDNVRGSKILVGASSESVFIRNCSQCVFSLACKQLRTRDCHDCIFFLYSKTEPVIEMSDGLTFAPFNVAYPGHAEQMASASLDPNTNLWSAIFDFNDEARTGEHWRIRDELLEGPLPMWYPLGEPCPPSVPIPASTSPLVGSQPPPPRDLGGGMATFSIAAMQVDAQKLAPPSSQGTSVSTSPSRPKKSGVGWDPSRLASPPSAPPVPPPPTTATTTGSVVIPAPPPPAPPSGKQPKSKVGWSEERLTATATNDAAAEGQALLTTAVTTSGGGAKAGEADPPSPLPQLGLPPLSALALARLIEADLDAAKALPRPLVFTKDSTDRSLSSDGEATNPWAHLALSTHRPQHLVLTIPDLGRAVDIEVVYHQAAGRGHLPEILTEEHQLSHAVFTDEFGEVVVPAYSKGNAEAEAAMSVLEVSAGLGRLSLRQDSQLQNKGPPGDAGVTVAGGAPPSSEEPWVGTIEFKLADERLGAIMSQVSQRVTLFFDSALTLARFSRYVLKTGEGEVREVTIRPQDHKYQKRKLT